MKHLLTGRLSRAVTIAVLVGAASLACAAAEDDRYAADPRLRRFVDSQHGETIAVELRRLLYRKRWNELLDQALYVIAPRGTWDDKRPAWAPARAALARALREEWVRWLADNGAEIRLVVNEQSMRGLTDDERRQTADFFESVTVMNYDLGALIHEGEVREGQVVGTPYIDGFLSYGTDVPATGTLLWFSPQAKAAPAPIASQNAGQADMTPRGSVFISSGAEANGWLRRNDRRALASQRVCKPLAAPQAFRPLVITSKTATDKELRSRTVSVVA